MPDPHLKDTHDNRLIGLLPLTTMTGPTWRAEKPVLLAVQAADPRAGAELTAYLHIRPGIIARPPDYAHRADVVLVPDGPLGDGTLAWIRRVAGQTAHESRFVVVGDGIQGSQLQQAAACGLVSILSQQDSSNDRIIEASHEPAAGPSPPAGARGLLAARPRPQPDEMPAAVRLAPRYSTDVTGSVRTTEGRHPRVMPVDVESQAALA